MGCLHTWLYTVLCLRAFFSFPGLAKIWSLVLSSYENDLLPGMFERKMLKYKENLIGLGLGQTHQFFGFLPSFVKKKSRNSADQLKVGVTVYLQNRLLKAGLGIKQTGG